MSALFEIDPQAPELPVATLLHWQDQLHQHIAHRLKTRVTDYTTVIAYGGKRAETLDASYYKGAGARNGREREFIAEKQRGRRYIVRRLTPTECARLQGLPDCWAIPVHKSDMTDAEAAFWEGGAAHAR